MMNKIKEIMNSIYGENPTATNPFVYRNTDGMVISNGKETITEVR